MTARLRTHVPPATFWHTPYLSFAVLPRPLALAPQVTPSDPEAESMMEQQQEQEWKVAALSRQRQEVGGESLDYPGRLALCPRGHARMIPTRFSRVEFELYCGQCRRSYRFRETTP